MGLKVQDKGLLHVVQHRRAGVRQNSTRSSAICYASRSASNPCAGENFLRSNRTSIDISIHSFGFRLMRQPTTPHADSSSSFSSFALTTTLLFLACPHRQCVAPGTSTMRRRLPAFIFDVFATSRTPDPIVAWSFACSFRAAAAALQRGAKCQLAGDVNSIFRRKRPTTLCSGLSFYLLHFTCHVQNWPATHRLPFYLFSSSQEKKINRRGLILIFKRGQKKIHCTRYDDLYFFHSWPFEQKFSGHANGGI